MRGSHRSMITAAAVAVSVLAAMPCHLGAATSSTKASAATALDTTVDLGVGMRNLWEDHITYTRNYIISALGSLGDTNAVAARLLSNQDDIGNAIKPYYGNAAGDALTALLRGHIVIATQVVAAAKASNTVALGVAAAAWTANADSIGAFLAGANPNWSQMVLDSMLHAHLAFTTSEAVGRLTMAWTADIAAYDMGHMHMLSFADMLTHGIVMQFPMQAYSATGRSADLRSAMRELWEDHISYTRNYIISALAGLGDTTAVATRLLANQDDIGNAIKPFYGTAAGDALTALLKGHIVIATQVVAAAKAGNSPALTDSLAAWTANADSIGAFLAGANPNWSQTVLDSMLHAHLTFTTNEAVSRLGANWAADIAAYDAGHMHMLMFADMLTNGILKQFPAGTIPRRPAARTGLSLAGAQSTLSVVQLDGRRVVGAWASATHGRPAVIGSGVYVVREANGQAFRAVRGMQ
jgi:hypothetical protein